MYILYLLFVSIYKHICIDLCDNYELYAILKCQIVKLHKGSILILFMNPLLDKLSCQTTVYTFGLLSEQSICCQRIKSTGLSVTEGASN